MLAELVWDHFQLQMLPEMKLRTKTSEKLLLFQMTFEIVRVHCINKKVGFGMAARVTKEAKL